MTDETTGADDTGAEGVEGVDTATTEAAAPAQPGPDLSRIEQKLAEVAQHNQMTAAQMAELYQHVTAEPEEPEWQPEPDDPEYDDWQAEQALQQFIAEQVQNGIKEALTPFQREQQERARLEGLVSIEERYPDLKNPETAKPVVQRAMQLAQRLGIPEDHPAFSDLIEQTYLAGQAQQLAAGNTPAGQDGARLEAGGGAAPGAADDEDPQERFIKKAAASGKSVWL